MVEFFAKLYESLIAFLRVVFQPVLDPIALVLQYPGEAVRQLILTIPISGAKALFIAYFVILIIWMMMFKKDEVQGKLHLFGNMTVDIRPIAIISLLGQIYIYYIFN